MQPVGVPHQTDQGGGIGRGLSQAAGATQLGLPPPSLEIPAGDHLFDLGFLTPLKNKLHPLLLDKEALTGEWTLQSLAGVERHARPF